MRTLLSLALVTAAAAAGFLAHAAERDPQLPPKPAIRWHKSFDAACKEAAASGKLVLLLQLHGDFEKELC